MTYGLTITGFNQKRQDVILAELQQALKDAFGEIGTDDDQIFGMLAGVFSNPVADIWELLAAVYSSQYRTAEGVSLDFVAEFVSLVRIAASRSTVPVAFGGSTGSVVPIGTQVQLVDAGAILESTEQVTLTAGSAVRARVTVASAVEDDVYGITINGIAITHTATDVDTEETIATALRAAIIANSTLNATVTVVRSGASLEITIQDPDLVFSIAVSVGVDIDAVFRQALCRAVDTGPIIIPLGSVTEIVTPVSGVTEVTNLIEGSQGRDQEADPALRTRIVSVPNGPGRSTEIAIKARLLAGVPGVTAVQVYSNRTDEVDGQGRPPHSIEVIVQSPGDDNDAIAQSIYDTAPGGIQLVSSLLSPSSGTAIDVNGNPVLVAFSRPTSKRVWLWVDVETFSEETFPENGTEAIAAALLTQGNQSVVGIDIIVQKFYAAIYSVPGVANAAIYMVVTDDPSPAKPGTPAENYVIGDAEIAAYAASRIAVEVVDP